MDHTTDVIVELVDGLSAEALPQRVLHETKRRLVDSLGCAIGAIDAPPARIARGLAADVTSALPSTVIGLRRPTSIELATFANTAMVRYLDYHDMYFSPAGAGGHPSDLIPCVLAVGEAIGARGSDVLLATVTAYEVNGVLAAAAWLRQR
ncbi:MAG: MmgE/PrpD family protein, partial [Chloroflexota bacterium]|nr:MmgE/PrpD family protein [Chloroflexota bacterium]